MVALTAKFALLLPFVLTCAHAANDWSVKCTTDCSYDTNGTDGRAHATVALSASNTQILADITSAASWELLDCPADWSSGSKDVRLVCVADDPADDCDDVTTGGAVDTIVRLPENCGTGPFARIAAWGTADDQSIPLNSTAETKLALRKRSAPPAQVMLATLDWQLSKIPSDRGSVKLDLKASNTPATNSRIVATRSLKDALHNRMERRFGLGDVIGAAKGAATAVAGAADDAKTAADAAASKAAAEAKTAAKAAASKVTKAASAATSVAVKAGDAVTSAAGAAASKAADATKINVSNSGSLDTIKANGTFPLFSTTLSCNVGLFGFDANVDTSVDLDAQMNIGFAFLMQGTVVPPALNDFGLAAAVSGYAKGTINVNALLSGDIDSGNIPVFKAGIPGLSFPGLLTLGPEAEINVRAGAGFDFNAALAIPIAWTYPLLDFVMPPSKGAASGDASEASTASVDFQASFTPGDLNANADVHVIPALTFGIDALGGFAKAEVFVQADADGSVDMNSTIADDFSMDGCVIMSTGINVNAGARGTFLKFFSNSTTIPIFNKRVTLFTKCFGADDGPASAIQDNGDGTFTNAAGDLVNENGELIDDTGAVIPDDAAAPPDEVVPPILDEKGKPIPDDTVLIDNGDGTFEDGLGNPTNSDGQLIDDLGNLLASELDLAGVTDDDGTAIAADDVIVENADGVFSANDGSQIDADGVPIDENGLVTGAGLNDVVDENGAAIAPEDLLIDNEDGTYADFFGNLVDQWGGAIDVDPKNVSSVLAVALAPEGKLEQPKQVDADPITSSNGTAGFVLKTPDEVKKIAQDLVGTAPNATAVAAKTIAAATPTDAPPPATKVKPPPAPAPAAKRRERRDLGLEKRAFGCQKPSFIGTAPVTSVDQLVRFF
ncbi:hypothetical protein C8R46DRAFT_1309474 [Mycena filopes]|nr:hypothetical protein C8R46DRAFT_1309474 [Mycena filopes]